MQIITRFWIRHWRLLGLIAAGAISIGGLLFRLGTLTTNLSATELQQRASNGSWHNLVTDPLYLPLHSLQWLALKVGGSQGATIIRLPSVLFGFLTIVAMTYVLRRWYGVRTAWFGAVLFACSSWLLHVSRYASNDVLYFWAIPTLLALQIIWERYGRYWYSSLFVASGFAALLYIPGMIWLLLISFCLQPHLLLQSWQQLGSWWRRLLIYGWLIILLLPLGYGLITNSGLIQTWLGLPQHFDSVQPVLKRLGLSLSYLGYRGPLSPGIWLDRLPVLDIFSLLTTGLGALFYMRHISAGRTRQLIGLFVIGALFFALQGPVSYSLLVPIAYLLAVAGIGYLLHEWLHTFPRNPLARALGYSLLTLAVIMASAYNLRAYYVAWPHSKATMAYFNRR